MNDCINAFNGERSDPVTGSTHLGLGYRAYRPILMRFASADGWSPFGAGGINPYTYCAGDPINRTDPTGHFSTGQWIGMALGLVAGLALSILTEGAAMPVALTLMAAMAGDAAIGAGSELAAEAVDGQRINWGQVGIAAGLSAATSIAGFGLGRLGKLKTGRYVEKMNHHLPLYGPGRNKQFDEALLIIPMRPQGKISGIIRNFRRIEAKTDISTFYDTSKRYPGQARLNIVSHGRVFSDNKITGEKLAELLGSHVKPDTYSSVRIIACNMAGDGGPDSLASQLARTLKKPVKAYRNEIRGSYYNSDLYNDLLVKGFSPSEIQEKFEGEFMYIPKDLDVNPRALWFEPDGYSYI